MFVTDSAGCRIGFIGAGRVATALARAFSAVGERVTLVYARTGARAQSLASRIDGCRAAASAQEVADGAELVFLAVPDDTIGPLASSLRWRAGQGVVHCSGGADLDVLAPARESGAEVGSFHPLQMFSEPEAALKGLSACSVAVEAGPELAKELERLVGLLGSRVLHVPQGTRAAYHAASHYAAAFLCVLLEEGANILQSIDIDRDQARRALLGLARGALDAIERDTPARAMAGVYARGDTGMAGRHLAALRPLGEDVRGFYRMLAERSIRLALAAGRITPERAELMLRLLQD